MGGGGLCLQFFSCGVLRSAWGVCGPSFSPGRVQPAVSDPVDFRPFGIRKMSQHQLQRSLLPS